jgi:hypothetical protein
MPKLKNEIIELKAFVSETDIVISALESQKVGEYRLIKVQNLVGDTYTDDDIDELSSMSQDSFDHLVASLTRVIDKIEATANDIEKERKKTDVDEKKFTSDEFLAGQALGAIKTLRKSGEANLLVRASKKDDTMAARNLVNNALMGKI